MICKNCGRRTFKGEKFCPKCGSPMPERPTLEEELQMNSRFKKTTTGSVQDYGEETKPVIPKQNVSDTEFDDPVFTPTLQFDSPKKTEDSPSDLGFYGSFGSLANDGLPPEKSPEPELEEFKPVFSTDTSFSMNTNNDFGAADPLITEENIPLPSSYASGSFNSPFSSSDDDDDLVIPEYVLQKNKSNESEHAKTLNYDVTAKIVPRGRRSERKKPVYEAIPDAIKEMVHMPKVIEPKAVASGTIRNSSDLPPLREGEMYVALNHRQLRRLKSRSFRGLGILTTLCLVIISAFCIWSYANSFADPIVGRWKGNVESQDIPIGAIQSLGQENFDSTWEFNDGGSMYLNLLINGSPVSLSGTYEEKNDEKGEQYLDLLLTNPMDGENYNFSMYYTITGQVLELNDMNGMGMTIVLQRE